MNTFELEPQTPARRRPSKQIVGAAAAVLALGVGGATMAVAATDTPTTQPTASAGGTEARGPGSERPDRGDHGRPGGPGLGQPLHGDLVVAKPTGGTLAISVQSGTVTAVSSTSLTIRSTDGFTGTYVLNSSTKVGPDLGKASALKVGQKVRLAAATSGKAVLMVGLQHDERPDAAPPMPTAPTTPAN